MDYEEWRRYGNPSNIRWPVNKKEPETAAGGRRWPVELWFAQVMLKLMVRCVNLQRAKAGIQERG